MKYKWTEVKMGDEFEMYQPHTLSKKEMNLDGPYKVYGANGVIGKHSEFNHETSQIMIGCRGTCGVVNISEPKSWINGNVMVIKPKRKNIDLEFLKHFLKYGLDLSAITTGASQPQITRQSLSRLKIKIPPLNVQQSISKIFHSADKILYHREQAINRLDRLIQNVFFEMFGDPLVDNSLFPKKKLQDLGSLDRGISKHRPRNDPILLNGPYPLIQTGDVSKCDDIINNYSRTYSEIGLKQSKLWPAGTLCITIAANIARTGILGIKACFPDSIVGFIANDKVLSNYVKHCLSFFQKKLEDKATSSAQKNINLEVLRNLFIPVPPIELQKKFCKKVDLIQNYKLSQNKNLNKIIAMKNSIIHKIFYVNENV